MSKGSLRRPLLISKEEEEFNWNAIFGKKSKEYLGEKTTLSVPVKTKTLKNTNDVNVYMDQDSKVDTYSRIDTIGQNGNDGIHYEYELNLSTGEVEKKFDGS